MTIEQVGIVGSSVVARERTFALKIVGMIACAKWS